MSLAIFLHAGSGGADLLQALWHLGPALAPGDRVALMDDSAPGGETAQRLRAFAGEEGPGPAVEIRHIALREAALPDRATAWAAARAAMGPGPALCLTERDVVRAEGLAALRAALQAGGADLLICHHGHYLSGAAASLPAPDAPAFAAGDRHAVLPDPRRLIDIGPDLVPVSAADPDPGRFWPLWESRLAAARAPRLIAEPVVLRPLPPDRSAAGLAMLRACLDEEDAAAAERLFARRLPWAEALLALAEPEAAPALLTALGALMQALPAPMRATLLARPGALGDLARAWQDTGAAGARSVLALQHAALTRARQQALEAEMRRMRRDLDLALPGPDYLMGLYQRLRRI